LLRLHVEDGDAVVRRAVAAGATSVTRLTELAWGDRVGRVRDPLGKLWWIQERVEEPTPDEVARRFQDPKLAEGMRYVQSTLASGLDPSQAGACQRSGGYRGQASPSAELVITLPGLHEASTGEPDAPSKLGTALTQKRPQVQSLSAHSL
jgi:hypothetical protein